MAVVVVVVVVAAVAVAVAVAVVVSVAVVVAVAVAVVDTASSNCRRTSALVRLSVAGTIANTCGHHSTCGEPHSSPLLWWLCARHLAAAEGAYLDLLGPFGGSRIPLPYGGCVLDIWQLLPQPWARCRPTRAAPQPI